MDLPPLDRNISSPFRSRRLHYDYNSSQPIKYESGSLRNGDHKIQSESTRTYSYEIPQSIVLESPQGHTEEVQIEEPLPPPVPPHKSTPGTPPYATKSLSSSSFTYGSPVPKVAALHYSYSTRSRSGVGTTPSASFRRQQDQSNMGTIEEEESSRERSSVSTSTLADEILASKAHTHDILSRSTSEGSFTESSKVTPEVNITPSYNYNYTYQALAPGYKPSYLTSTSTSLYSSPIPSYYPTLSYNSSSLGESYLPSVSPASQTSKTPEPEVPKLEAREAEVVKEEQISTASYSPYRSDLYTSPYSSSIGAGYYKPLLTSEYGYASGSLSTYVPSTTSSLNSSGYKARVISTYPDTYPSYPRTELESIYSSANIAPTRPVPVIEEKIEKQTERLEDIHVDEHEVHKIAEERPLNLSSNIEIRENEVSEGISPIRQAVPVYRTETLETYLSPEPSPVATTKPLIFEQASSVSNVSNASNIPSTSYAVTSASTAYSYGAQNTSEDTGYQSSTYQEPYLYRPLHFIYSERQQKWDEEQRKALSEVVSIKPTEPEPEPEPESALTKEEVDKNILSHDRLENIAYIDELSNQSVDGSVQEEGAVHRRHSLEDPLIPPKSVTNSENKYDVPLYPRQEQPVPVDNHPEPVKPIIETEKKEDPLHPRQEQTVPIDDYPKSVEHPVEFDKKKEEPLYPRHEQPAPAEQHPKPDTQAKQAESSPFYIPSLRRTSTSTDSDEDYVRYKMILEEQKKGLSERKRQLSEEESKNDEGAPRDDRTISQENPESQQEHQQESPENLTESDKEETATSEKEEKEELRHGERLSMIVGIEVISTELLDTPPKVEELTERENHQSDEAHAQTEFESHTEESDPDTPTYPGLKIEDIKQKTIAYYRRIAESDRKTAEEEMKQATEDESSTTEQSQVDQSESNEDQTIHDDQKTVGVVEHDQVTDNANSTTEKPFSDDVHEEQKSEDQGSDHQNVIQESENHQIPDSSDQIEITEVQEENRSLSSEVPEITIEPVSDSQDMSQEEAKELVQEVIDSVTEPNQENTEFEKTQPEELHQTEDIHSNESDSDRTVVEVPVSETTQETHESNEKREEEQPEIFIPSLRPERTHESVTSSEEQHETAALVSEQSHENIQSATESEHAAHENITSSEEHHETAPPSEQEQTQKTSQSPGFDQIQEITSSSTDQDELEAHLAEQLQAQAATLQEIQSQLMTIFESVDSLKDKLKTIASSLNSVEQNPSKKKPDSEQKE
ncbi:hypothetical protein WR25_17246 [Diploscapter pachys]|uniref:Uncharacterized protein n=1 Tax=Diploscapter pachys TaxID=2018661 RepID=A0A2A2LVF4_9BILA|nr:hypothetical protein WR25_17246 [Diploscapter pachys]